jgi:DNA-binding transcriptional MocR family regulator
MDEVSSRLSELTARGLAGAVSRAIGEGALEPGYRLPPIRTVARELGFSPTTVSAAWHLLARSGAIHTDGRRGTVVAQPRTAGPRRYRRALRYRAPYHLDLSTGVPDPALLPDLGPALRRIRVTSPSSYLDEPVLPDLDRVLRARWAYPVERMAVFDGAMDAIDQVASSLLRLGDVAVVENPCFPPLLDLLEALGVQVLGVDLDGEGARPDQLAAALARRPAAVFLQPRAHNPTGASWTEGRARDLARALADAPEVIVVEDDSAGDLSGSALFSLGRMLPRRTVHIASFAKSHGPDLRIAAVGGPASILDPIVERRLIGQGWTSRILQHLLLDLLTDPASIAAVAKAKREYARRRRLICEPLRASGVDVNGADGLNLWLPVRDEHAALISLASEGVGAAGGAAFLAHPGEPHLRVTVGLVARGHAALAAKLARASALTSSP